MGIIVKVLTRVAARSRVVSRWLGVKVRRLVLSPGGRASALASFSAAGARVARPFSNFLTRLGLPPGSRGRRILYRSLNYGGWFASGYSLAKTILESEDQDPWLSNKPEDMEQISHAHLSLAIAGSDLTTSEKRRLLTTLAVSRLVGLGYADSISFQMLTMAIHPEPEILGDNVLGELEALIQPIVGSEWTEENVAAALSAIFEDGALDEDDQAFLISDPILASNLAWNRIMLTQLFPLLRNLDSSETQAHEYYSRLTEATTYAMSWPLSRIERLIICALSDTRPDSPRFVGQTVLMSNPKKMDLLLHRFGSMTPGNILAARWQSTIKYANSGRDLDRALRLTIFNYIEDL